MPNTYVESTKIKSIYIGIIKFKSIYIGVNKVWSGFELPKFTGQHAIFGNEEKGRIECYSSGTITLSEGKPYDMFAVGGGGNGFVGTYYTDRKDKEHFACGSGGGAGYTKTIKSQLLSETYNVAIGAASGATNMGSVISASGGINPQYSSTGGNGGSGGGAGSHNSSSDHGVGGAGGTNGGNGLIGVDPLANAQAGTGQGTTTKAFGESSNTLYAGGGGGGLASGGAGGGGNGQIGSTRAQNGTANTGGGGGGGSPSNVSSGAGGSGILIIRWGY